MKRIIRSLSLVALLSVILISCEEDKPIDNSNIRDEYLGDWSANDVEGWNAPAFYDITIKAGSQSDEIIIVGLYNNPNVELEAYLDEYEVDIPSQSSDSISFSGSGKANVEFDQITFQYTSNDGSGSDQVKTVCTRMP